MNVFQELIYNTDPNLGNMLITNDWQVKIIDFTREFRTREGLRTPEDPGSAFGIFRIPTVAACHALMMSPIPNKFPELRWGFIEASAGWVPWVITEAKNRYQGAGRKFPANVMKEYNIYVTCQTDDDVPYILQCAGEDNIVIGTDYGHFDPSSEVDAISVLKEQGTLSESAMTKILRDNPKAMYGLS